MTDRIRLSCLIGLLLFSTVELRWTSHGRSVPPRNDFDTFPQQVDDWSGENLPDLDPAVRKELAADNYLLRNYHHTTDPNIGLFIAYYGSQRSGDALHSDALVFFGLLTSKVEPCKVIRGSAEKTLEFFGMWRQDGVGGQHRQPFRVSTKDVQRIRVDHHRLHAPL